VSGPSSGANATSRRDGLVDGSHGGVIRGGIPRAVDVERAADAALVDVERAADAALVDVERAADGALVMSSAQLTLRS